MVVILSCVVMARLSQGSGVYNPCNQNDCVLVSCSVVSNSLQPHRLQPTRPLVQGILQARTLEWVAISFSKRNYRKKESKVAQLCPTLCDPMDCSPPGFPIHGIFQTRILEWFAISFSNFIAYLVKIMMVASNDQGMGSFQVGRLVTGSLTVP